MAEDEMVGWHHRLGGHEFEQALGIIISNTIKMELVQASSISKKTCPKTSFLPLISFYSTSTLLLKLQILMMQY